MVKTVDGLFHSEGEFKRWEVLKLLEQAGEIRNLERQKKFSLTINGVLICEYFADFCYDKNTKEYDFCRFIFLPIVEDFKGVRTPEYKLKKKLMKAIYGIEILETSAPKEKKRWTSEDVDRLEEKYSR